MTKRLRVIILLLVSSFACYAQRLKSVEVSDYNCVDTGACRLQFPAGHQKFEALYRRMEHIRCGGDGVVNILHVGGSHVQAGMMSHRLRCNFSQMMPERPQSRGLVFPFRAIRTNAPTDYSFSVSA